MGYPREPLSETPMAGRGARRRADRSGGRFLGLAGIVLAILTIVFLLRPWPTRIAGDFVVPISLPSSPQFWIVFFLFLAQVVVAYMWMRERGRLRTALSLRRAPAFEEPESELRPYREIQEQEVEYVEAPGKETEDAVEYVPDHRPLPAVPAAEGRKDGEFSKLMEWIDAVSDQISGWAGEVMESVDHAVHPKKTKPATPLVLADRQPNGTTTTACPKLGACAEMRARAAIEKFLRKRPWAPAADIAKELGMDLRLATRVTATVREESVR